MKGTFALPCLTSGVKAPFVLCLTSLFYSGVKSTFACLALPHETTAAFALAPSSPTSDF